MSESFKYRLNDLFELLVAGEYHDVIEKTDKILQKKESSVEERIEALILKGRSLYFLSLYEYRRELRKEGIAIIEEALRLSSEIEDYLLMLESLYIQSRNYSSDLMHEESLECIEQAEEIYEKLKTQYPALATEKKHSFYGFWIKNSIVENNWIRIILGI